MAYWYNIRSKQVETDDTRGRDEEVMGPYATEAEARDAIEHARQNTERWDAEDRREREWETGDSGEPRR